MGAGDSQHGWSLMKYRSGLLENRKEIFEKWQNGVADAVSIVA